MGHDGPFGHLPFTMPHGIEFSLYHAVMHTPVDGISIQLPLQCFALCPECRQGGLPAVQLEVSGSACPD